MSNAVQTLIDSKFGLVFSTALHTLGAVGILGGLIGYVAWHRHLVKGHHHGHVLATATFLAYFSIVVNLIGGFMRTYETGHPHITDFASSAWVRAIAIKHVFLFAGMGAAVYLFERVAPAHRRALKAGTLDKQSMTGHNVGVLLVSLGILVSGILGAVSTILPVGAAPMDDVVDDPLVDAYQNATGQLFGNPAVPAMSSGQFAVGQNRTDLAVTLTWTPTQSSLRIELLDPRGTSQFIETGTAGRLEVALGEAPDAGQWTYRITSPDPIVNAQWSLVIHLPATGSHAHA